MSSNWQPEGTTLLSTKNLLNVQEVFFILFDPILLTTHYCPNHLPDAETAATHRHWAGL